MTSEPVRDAFDAGGRGLQHQGLRRANERAVLTVIGFNPGVSNADIARLSGLAPQTVSAILTDLDGMGLIARGEVLRGRRGQPATPDQWDQRTLPAPEARVAFAAIEKSDRFGARWGRWVRRLGIRDTSQVSVLADGARWIWEETAMHLAGATEVLDVYHALEKASQTADALYEEVRRHFDEKAIVDLTLAIIAINGWNRMNVAFRTEVGGYVSPHAAPR